MALEVLLKAGLTKVGERVIGAVPGLGTAIAGTMLLKEVVDKHSEEVCFKARQKLQCNCIKVCPQVWGPRTASCSYPESRKVVQTKKHLTQLLWAFVRHKPKPDVPMSIGCIDQIGPM